MGPERGSVVVVGAINVDLVVAAPRLPGPGETVVGGDLQRYGGGKGANAAVAAARAGATVHLIGAVGDDDTGTAALAELAAEGIDLSGVARLAGTATGVALIVVDPEGENQIAVGSGANAAVSAEHVHRVMEPLLLTAGCVLVSTEIPLAAVAAAVTTARAGSVTCVLNPAPVIAGLAELLAVGPILTPNRTEIFDLGAQLGAVAPRHVESIATEELALQLANATAVPVIVTLGAGGVLLLEPAGTSNAVPARPTKVRDTTGAGDTFNGVLAARLARGDELRRAVEVAVVAASLSVAELGARGGMPTEAAITAAIDGTD